MPIRQVDPTFYNGLVWMLENDITDVLDNTFTDEHDAFGVIEQGCQSLTIYFTAN